MIDIPKVSIIKNGQIYVPFDYSTEEIPNDSILYNQQIYIKFKNDFKAQNDINNKKDTNFSIQKSKLDRNILNINPKNPIKKEKESRS